MTTAEKLWFWISGEIGDRPAGLCTRTSGRSVKRLEGQPFALLGINSDRDREALKKVMEKEGITWRSFWNGGSTGGPISTKWDVHSWPTIYVLDHTGVVRYKNVRGERMDEAVDTLLKELKESKQENIGYCLLYFTYGYL